MASTDMLQHPFDVLDAFRLIDFDVVVLEAEPFQVFPGTGVVGMPIWSTVAGPGSGSSCAQRATQSPVKTGFPVPALHGKVTLFTSREKIYPYVSHRSCG